MKPLGGGWDELLGSLFADEKYLKIREFIKYEYTHNVVYPNMYDIYNCFRYTPVSNLKAVILGQDHIMNPVKHMGCAFRLKME